MQGIGLFKTDAHDVACLQDELNNDHILNGGPLHCHDLLDQVCAVDHSSFLQIFAGVRKGCGVHDGCPAGTLPDAADDVDGAERFRQRHEVDAGVKQAVHRTGDTQQHPDDTAQHDDRDEVGHIQHQLHLLLDLLALDTVEQECQQDGDREAPQQTVDAQLQGVDQIALEVRRGHEAGKVFEAYPLAAPDTFEGIVLLERDQHTAHGRVLEHQRQHHSRQQEQQVKLPMPFDVDPCVVQLAFCCQHSRFRRGCLCFHESFSSFLICLPLDLHFTFAPLNLALFTLIVQM